MNTKHETSVCDIPVINCVARTVLYFVFSQRTSAVASGVCTVSRVTSQSGEHQSVTARQSMANTVKISLVE